MAPNAPLHPRLGLPPISTHVAKVRLGSPSDNSHNEPGSNNKRARTVPGAPSIPVGPRAQQPPPPRPSSKQWINPNLKKAPDSTKLTRSPNFIQQGPPSGVLLPAAASSNVTITFNDDHLSPMLDSSDDDGDLFEENLPDINAVSSERREHVPVVRALRRPQASFHRPAPRGTTTLRDHRLSRSRIETPGRYRRSGIPPDIRNRISLRELSTVSLSTVSLATGHYTISQDHTAGEEARRSHLFASFGRKLQRQPETQEVPIAQPDTGQGRMATSMGPNFAGHPGHPVDSGYGDVLSDFDFDSFLHDKDGDNSAFNFTEAFPMGDEIGDN